MRRRYLGFRKDYIHESIAFEEQEQEDSRDCVLNGGEALLRVNQGDLQMAFSIEGGEDHDQNSVSD